MPVTGSSFVFRWAIVQEGVMRRSDEEAVELMMRGMSRLVVRVWAMVCLGDDYKARTAVSGGCH